MAHFERAGGSTTAGRLRSRARARSGYLRRRASSPAALVVVAIGVGFAFAGSPDELAPGTKIAGVDVGGMTAARGAGAAREAGRDDGRRARRLRRRRPPAGRSARATLGVERRLARRGRGGAAPRRRLRLRPRLPAPRAPLLARSRSTPTANVVPGRGRLRGRRARRRRSTGRRATRGSTGAASGSSSPRARPATVLDQDAAAARGRRRRSRASSARPVALPVVAEQPKVSADDLERRGGARPAHRLGAGHASPSAARSAALTRWQLASMLVLQRRRGREAGARRPAGRHVLRRPRPRGRPRAEGRDVRRRAATRFASSPPQHGPRARRPASRARPCSRPPSAPAPRVARLAARSAQPKRSTADAKAMGITGVVGTYETIYGGDREPDPQRPARRAPDRRQADRARRDVLVQPRDRRADRREGLPRGAGDHQRRARDRARRRRLPGLDDRVQRGVRGRAADHRAHEPRALHLALPARPRRDRRLPGRRPQVRERHEALAAPADVRRLVLARRLAVRHAAAPPRRDARRRRS